MFINNINNQDIKKITFNWLETSSSKKAENDYFFKNMKRALKEVSDTQRNAKTDNEEFVLNKPHISLNDIMIDLDKSYIATQIAVQVRNKFVSAYQEIMNQQV
ncbi:flagellar hook-basal body complex protein FliE [Buchnera aphidicola str. Ua (Uroleucon ambrosiae)]|uniref:Flagellar hook-basal body complex protein FliE n=2 Tax=Buchnera aphidicola TaxID=9 RepID=G2LNV8_BUCUM|nr:flagellar hook-basal body complex protein FliE [Buchnera aphidicola str. Ua (Uroleucon ambrosiae)]